MNLCLINYGACNLFSLESALLYLGVKAIVSDSMEDIKKSDKLILPGVGHFSSAMKKLKSLNLMDGIQHEIAIIKKPILGICLGMQLLTKSSEEANDEQGLGLIDLQVESLSKKYKGIRSTHIGFNEVFFTNPGILYKNMNSRSDFYFNHSYAALTNQDNMIIGESHYGGDFICSFEKDNIFGVQFHPELSQDHGLHVLKNFLEL